MGRKVCLKALLAELRAQQAIWDASKIGRVSLDMAKNFIAGARKHLPEATLSFDPFHVIKLVNEAVDTLRRAEVVLRFELKRMRTEHIAVDAGVHAAGFADGRRGVIAGAVEGLVAGGGLIAARVRGACSMAGKMVRCAASPPGGSTAGSQGSYRAA